MALDNFANFAVALVSTGYDAAATSVVLTTGYGAKMPAAPFNAVWWNATDYASADLDPNVEIIRVTARASDTLTVTRAQEGTGATTKNTAAKQYKILAGLTATALNQNTPRQLWGGVGQIGLQPGTTATSFLPGGTVLTVPANALQPGDRLTVRAIFSHGGGTSAQSYQLLLNGSLGLGFNSFAAGNPSLTLSSDIVIRTTSLLHVTESKFSGQNISAFNGSTFSIPSTSAITLDLQAKFDAASGTDTLTLDNYNVVLYRAS